MVCTRTCILLGIVSAAVAVLLVRPKEVVTHHEGVVERGKYVRDAEDVLSLCHLGAEGNPLLHLVLLLLVRLAYMHTYIYIYL